MDETNKQANPTQINTITTSIKSIFVKMEFYNVNAINATNVTNVRNAPCNCPLCKYQGQQDVDFQQPQHQDFQHEPDFGYESDNDDDDSGNHIGIDIRPDHEIEPQCQLELELAMVIVDICAYCRDTLRDRYLMYAIWKWWMQQDVGYMTYEIAIMHLLIFLYDHTTSAVYDYARNKLL